jgi:hypothetical protein
VFLLDDPERFRATLTDRVLIHWMTDVFQFGPAVLRQRLIELLDPTTIAAIAAGPHAVAASDLIHILPDETMSNAGGWIAEHWPELDEDVALEALRKLTDVSPDIAQRLAIEHVARVGDKFPEDIRDGACLDALAQGRSEECQVVAQQLVDRFLAGNRFGLRSALLGLCLNRDLPGGPAAILQELVRARDRRKLKGCLQRLLDRLPGSLDFRFVIEDAIIRRHPRPLSDLGPLIDPRTDLKALARILRHSTSTPVAGLIAWGRKLFGSDDRSMAMRLLEEGRNLDGLDLELVTLAATMFLRRLAVKAPPLGDLTLDRVMRIVEHPIDLGDLARQFADRLCSFPNDQVLRELRKFLGPGDHVDPMARFNALAILRELALPGAFDTLFDQLGRGPDDPAVDHGVSCLVALGQPAAERLVKRFRGLTEDVQIQVCRVIARTGGPAAYSLVNEWLPRSSGDLRVELCDVIKFWPDASYVAVLEPSAPGEDAAADEALVVMDLLYGIGSPRIAARREELLKEHEPHIPAACPHCGHKVQQVDGAHADHDHDDEYDEDELGDADANEETSTPPQPQAVAPVPVAEKVGRNDPCPCGSGKKFKKCCLGKSEAPPEREPSRSSPPPEWQVEVELPPPKVPKPGTVEMHADAPRDLRRRLERARLESIALLRTMDRAMIYLSPEEFSPELRAVFELEADCAEALWGLDQPFGAFSVSKMLRDTLGSLERLPGARAAALAVLEPEDLRNVMSIKGVVARTVRPEECYSQVKGRDPS